MYKSLLIHHDNIPDTSLFDTTVLFDSDGDIDSYIQNAIIPLLVKHDFDIVFVKDNLSLNYLELYGLIMAYHIRVTPELKDKQYVPIVILSDLDAYSLNKLNTKANIIFTPNTFIATNSQKSVKYYISSKTDKLTPDNYTKGFLEHIQIHPPKETKHDIANLWAIYRWSEYLNAKSEAITKNKNEIASMLYFKYLNAKYPLPKKRGIRRVPIAPQPVLNEKYKILYIDDEWANGWADILSTYFSKSESIDFETFQYDFKDNSQDTIIDNVTIAVKKTDPDLILLDLRLSQSDHTEEDIENLTGIKLIDNIKSINKGIQIIMISATGKSLTLERMYEKGILGYIKKDRPGDIGLGVADNYDRLKTLTQMGVEKKFLKKIWLIQEEILGLDIFTNENYTTLKSEIDSIFEMLDSNMNNKFNFAILSFSKSLETISNLFINEHTMKYIDNTSIGVYNSYNNMIDIHRDEKWYKNIENRLHNIMQKKLNITDKKSHVLLCELINCRNYIVHPKKKTPNGCELVTKPTEEKIIEWFGLICKILTGIKRG